MNDEQHTKIKVIYAIDQDGLCQGMVAIPEDMYNPELHVTQAPPASPHRDRYEAVWNKENKQWSLRLTAYGKQQVWEDIKYTRNELLSRTDWTQMTDVVLSPEKRAAVEQYRQELRDITKKYLDPEQLIWPKNPFD